MTSLMIFRCPSCGAPANPEAENCTYCGADFELVRCPDCGVPNLAKSRTCTNCHSDMWATTRIEGTNHDCPTCSERLQAIVEKGQSLEHCPKCQGIWIRQSDFYALCLAPSITIDWSPSIALNYFPKQKLATELVTRYRSCLECGLAMTRVNFGRASGIVVDMCREHGTWFEAGELPAIMGFLKAGGLQHAGLDPRDYLALHIHPADNQRLARAFSGVHSDATLDAKSETSNGEVVYQIVQSLLGIQHS